MFLGGLAIFMYGVGLTSKGLQKYAANRLKQILQSITKKTFIAVLFGMIMTVAFQSSAATTVLVVEFVNAGLMNLAQSLSIVLGSAVGTSITIQLIAFQILDLALGAVFIGFILYLAGSRRWQYLGQALIGFGIIFVGMNYMSQASAPLKTFPAVYHFLSHLAAHPVIAIMVGIVLTSVIQSSTAVFAIMMSLAGQHLLSLSAIVPLVLGAHTGGTITTLLSSFTAKKMDAKRTAIANTGYKVVATVIIYPFLHQFAQLVQWTTASVQRQVANAHLLFAVLMVLIFFPFNGLIAKGLQRWLPDRPEPGIQPKLKFIDQASLELPTVALEQAAKEIVALGQFIADTMLDKIPPRLPLPTGTDLEEIMSAEASVDRYYNQISHFLGDLAHHGLTDEQTEESIKSQFVLKELEYIGDILMSMVQLLNLWRNENPVINDEEWNQLRELYHQVSANFNRMLQALEHWDSELAGAVIREHPEIAYTQRNLLFNALARGPLPTAGESDDPEGKLRYVSVDLINYLYDIDEHAVNIAQVVMGII